MKCNCLACKAVSEKKPYQPFKTYQQALKEAVEKVKSTK